MSALARLPAASAPIAPDTGSAIFGAVAEATATAATYAQTATAMAEIGDLRGAAYGIRCAAAAIQNAAELLEELTKAASLKSGGRRQ